MTARHQTVLRKDERRFASAEARNILPLSAAILLALGISASADAANFVVRSAADSGPMTLRQAIIDANATTGPHSIFFVLPAATTITLTSGQMALTGPDITVQGTGRDELTISGNHSSRIFDVEAGSLTLNDVTLRDGLAQGDATNFYDEVGGAIRVGALPPPVTPAQLATTRHRATIAAGISGRGQSALGLHALQMFSQSVVSGLPAPSLTIDHVSLLNNRADAPKLAAGGAVFASAGATLVVRNSLFEGNSSSWVGGAICAIGGNDIYSVSGIGNFDIVDTTIAANHIDQNGGGPSAGQGAGILMFGPGGSVRRSIFRDNVINDAPADQELTEGLGGALAFGIYDGAPITIADSEISGNTIALRPGAYSEGAGIYCREYYTATPLTITNTTISGNQSEYGAAIEMGCNLHLDNSTVAGNSSPNTAGAGDAIEMIFDEGKFNAVSTLVFNPAAHVDLFLFEGTDELGIVSKSLVFAPDPSAPPLPADTLIGIDPMLSALQNNGGPTRTERLLPESAAVDAGSNPHTLAFDQRGTGFARVVGAAADIGAFEFDADRILTNGFE